jgi:quinol monooxygenase YgiN
MPLRVNAKFPHIPPSTLADFKRTAAEALELTKREPGALQYDWFLKRQ